MKRSILVAAPAAVLALAMLGGCASKQPPAELVDARAAYTRAQSGVAAQANPAGLFEARQALVAAEKKFDDDPGADEVRHLAYIAQRKTMIAEAEARANVAQSQQVQAAQMLEQMREQQLRTAQGQLHEVKGMLTAEQQARLQAEMRAKEALDKLGVTKEDPRGMVLTISGAVLFQTGKSALMPQARERLSGVADALKEVQGKKIIIVGHTDNVGSASSNDDLSMKRAEAVRVYLISRGVSPDRVEALGKGESDPVASNESAEGRANNRRVEIVIAGGLANGKEGAGENPTMQESPSKGKTPPQHTHPKTNGATPGGKPPTEKAPDGKMTPGTKAPNGQTTPDATTTPGGIHR